MSASLLCLPLELLELTADYLEPQDVFNLRMVTSHLGNGLTKYMARRFFKEVHVLLFEATSMNMLLSLVEHPVYQKAVRTITFNIATLIGAEEPDQGPLGSSVHQNHIATSVYAAQNRFRKELMPAVLSKILRTLMVAGNIAEVKTQAHGAANLQGPVERPWGVKAMRKLLWDVDLRYDVFHYEGSSDSSYPALCQAISETGYPIQKLALGDEHCCFGLSALMPQSRTNNLPFKNLRTLKLYLGRVLPWDPAQFREGRFVTNRIAILWLVSQAQQLESLTLRISNGYHSPATRHCDWHIFRALAISRFRDWRRPMRNIKHLSLSGHEIRKEMLLHFIRDHRATLRKLDLWEIIDGKLDDRGIKHDIFAAMAGIEDFQLMCGRVYEGTRPCLYDGDPGWVLPAWETADMVLPGTS